MLRWEIHGSKLLPQTAYQFKIYHLARAEVIIGNTVGDAGVIFRATSIGNGKGSFRGYYAGISRDNGGSLVLGRVDNKWKELRRIKMNIDSSKKYTVKVRALGDELSVFLDDLVSPKFTVRDGTFRNGAVGVRARGTAANFDNVVISLVVFDNFERNLVGWRIYDGGFDARTGELVASNVVSGKIAHQAVFQDLSLEANITFYTKDNGGNAGFIFRATAIGNGPDAYHGYYAGLSGNGELILGRVDGSWKQIDHRQINVRLGQKHHVKITAVGSLMQIYVDNMAWRLISFNDATFKSGVTGVRVFKSGAVVDNYSIGKVE